MTRPHPAPTTATVPRLRRWRRRAAAWLVALARAPGRLPGRPSARVGLRAEVHAVSGADAGIARIEAYLAKHAAFEEYCRLRE